MLVTLLTLAVGAMLVPTLAVRLETPAAHHTHALSDATAVILLLVYVASIPFWLSGGPTPEWASPGRQAAGGRWPPTVQTAGAGQALAAQHGRHRAGNCRAASAAASDWFVSSLVPATRSLGISPVFTGLVIVAIASNAVENSAGIRFAWKARPDYAISTILNSPLQIALFLTPVLVLGSAFFGQGS